MQGCIKCVKNSGYNSEILSEGCSPFQKSTALEGREFKLLCGLDLFNSAWMNETAYKLKKHENSSLSYAIIETAYAHANRGLYDMVLTEEYHNMYIC